MFMMFNKFFNLLRIFGNQHFFALFFIFFFKIPFPLIAYTFSSKLYAFDPISCIAMIILRFEFILLYTTYWYFPIQLSIFRFQLWNFEGTQLIFISLTPTFFSILALFYLFINVLTVNCFDFLRLFIQFLWNEYFGVSIFILVINLFFIHNPYYFFQYPYIFTRNPSFFILINFQFFYNHHFLF